MEFQSAGTSEELQIEASIAPHALVRNSRSIVRMSAYPTGSKANAGIAVVSNFADCSEAVDRAGSA
jgi:hypothetical protein